MKKGCIIRFAALALAFCMALSGAAFAAEAAEEKVDYGAKLDEAIGLYLEYGLFSDEDTDYIREALIKLFEEDDELFYKFMNYIYGSSDRYSYYMEPEVYDESFVMESTKVGIGVTITPTEEGELEITNVPAGPAKEAGLKTGDIIVAVDGVDVRGYLPAMVVDIIRGEENTSVSIMVERNGQQLSFSVTRRVITVSSVSAEKISDKVGYISLSHFNGISAFMDFMAVYDDFEASGINTVVLDLRDNTGGELDCLINLMDNIIPEEGVPYLSTWTTKPLSLRTFLSEGYGWEFNKFIILVNENTASAAEMMAGALADLGYAEIVGTTTYGKGMGQVHIETSDGDEAIITAVQMKLPTSGSYDGVGIIPDHKVELDIRPFKLPYLTPLINKSEISPIKRDNLRAVEERLQLLGYLYTEPDDEWDIYTVHAINMFCRDQGIMEISSRCSWELIEKIDAACKKLEEKFVVTDTQLEYALKLAEQYSQSEEKAKRVDDSEIDFKED